MTRKSLRNLSLTERYPLSDLRSPTACSALHPPNEMVIFMVYFGIFSSLKKCGCVVKKNVISFLFGGWILLQSFIVNFRVQKFQLINPVVESTFFFPIIKKRMRYFLQHDLLVRVFEPKKNHNIILKKYSIPKKKKEVSLAFCLDSFLPIFKKNIPIYNNNNIYYY